MATFFESKFVKMVSITLFATLLLVSQALAVPRGPFRRGSTASLTTGVDMDGYSYTYWNGGSGSFQCQNGNGGQFSAQWTNGNGLCGKGWSSGGSRSVKIYSSRRSTANRRTPTLTK
jgi:endo-1,4-beta-xylanase